MALESVLGWRADSDSMEFRGLLAPWAARRFRRPSCWLTVVASGTTSGNQSGLVTRVNGQ
jgi:hypothetical protein